MKPLAKAWVEKAEGEFQVASHVLRLRKKRVPDAVCFHCQQCAEKYFYPGDEATLEEARAAYKACKLIRQEARNVLRLVT